MTSQSEHLSGFDLGAQRGTLGVVDLLMRSEGPRGVTGLRYPEFHAELETATHVDSSVLEMGGRDLDAEEVHAKVAVARAESLAQAKREHEVELAGRLAEERRRVDRLRLEFARDRQRFFAAAESQVVRLALAVAGRVLSREVTSDGLHLRATVKAALARVQDSSVTTLRVPVDEEDAWTTLFRRGSAGKVTVIGDERMSAGECVLDTSVGRVELGVEVQLAEIERGFRELVQGDGWEMPGAPGRDRRGVDQERNGTR
jgi:flagellar assembly protein FliH